MRTRRLALALVALLAAPHRAAPQAAFDEYRVKAAFLFKFAKFVEWPAQAYQDEPGHQVFCVFGTDPFGPILDQTLAGKTVEGRLAVVRRVRELDELRRCHLVFLAAGEETVLPEILDHLGSLPVLLVGDDPDFARQGGTISFVLRQGHVQFAINPRAAQQARLKIDSQLLDLAEIVSTETE
jgi:hypothetical protein